MSEMLTKKFKQSLFELFKNAELHASSKSGIFVCGQYYHLTKKLSFTLSDAGVGIHNNVHKFLKKEISDIDSIKWALEEGNSTRENDQPGGIGLKLIKNFMKLNGGKVLIVSGLGYYEFNDSNEHFRTMTHSFPGTCVNIEINTNDSKSYYLRSELNFTDIF